MKDLPNKEYQGTDNLDQILKPYLSRWSWMLLFLVLFLAAAHIYLRYADDVYEASTTILIKDTRSGGGISELGAFSEIGVLGSNSNSIENEIQILKSRRLMSSVCKELNLGTNIYRKGNFKNLDLYQSHPFIVHTFDNNNVDSLISTTKFEVVIQSDSTYSFRNNQQEDYKEFTFGDIHKTLNNSFILVPDFSVLEKVIGLELMVQIKDPIMASLSFSGKLQITEAARSGSVLNLKISDQVPARAKDILNELVKQFNIDAINDKNIVALNTARFIDERLDAISIGLDSTELKKQDFKESLGLTDISAEVMMNLQGSQEYKKQVSQIDTEIQIINYFINYIKESNSKTTLPVNVGIADSNLNGLINEYNIALIEYNELLEFSTTENPTAINLKEKIDLLKSNIISSISNYQKSLSVKRQKILEESNRISGRIAQIPSTERISRDIEREREIIESIYLFLLQKKEETAISLAVTSPKAKIVDAAFDLGKVAPQPLVIYAGSAIAGFILPIVFIYIMVLFNNKIESRKDIQRYLPDMNILGEVPKLDSDTLDYIVPNDRSVLAESFRIIRTNLQYKLNAIDHDKTKVVLVTSTVKGEGKTLVAYNIANTFAFSGKKVLLIGGDIRNPQLHRYSSDKVSKRTKGVTEYLVTNELLLEDLVIRSSLNSNLDVILSGAIPPNPAELWMQDRTKKLFEEARNNYDLVIIDSAPTILVTDTLLINKYADVTAYVTRASYTDVSLLEFVSDTIDQGKLSNVAAVINNVKLANFGYGNKYGYAYGAEKKSLLKRLKSVFST
ncbi:GumC family protein [Nonlabens sp.]|uniref:GumC family protein n=1 Tax=Nonlabens sp. TaxID=1888209 RepID=UPI003F69DBD0